MLLASLIGKSKGHLLLSKSIFFVILFNGTNKVSFSNKNVIISVTVLGSTAMTTYLIYRGAVVNTSVNYYKSELGIIVRIGYFLAIVILDSPNMFNLPIFKFELVRYCG